MTWLEWERARAYAVIAACGWIALLVLIIRSLRDGVDAQGHLLGGDFVSFWAASRLVMTGWAADAYVQSVHYLAQLASSATDVQAFFYPPTYLLLCAPLALLPYFPALIVFQAATGGAYLWTLRSILCSRWAYVAALTSPLVGTNLIAGQNAFLTTALMGSGLSLLDRRPRLAGVLLGLMAIKPHLAVVVPLALLFWRRWTTLVWAGGTAICFIALSLIAFGWAAWAAFFEHTSAARAALEEGWVGYAKMQSPFALALILGLPRVTAYLVQAAVAACAVAVLAWAAWRRVPPALERSLIVVAGLLCTPFVLHYDMLLMMLPLAWMLRAWIDDGFPPWSKLVLILVLVAPSVYVFRGPASFGAPVTLAFGAYLVWLSAGAVRRAPHMAEAPSRTVSVGGA
ncbi:MAG: glycosyltransferase family 87 protein [Acetobacteraceae bacterium]